MTITILNHDTGETTQIPLEEFIKRFNDQRMSDEIFSITGIVGGQDGKSG